MHTNLPTFRSSLLPIQPLPVPLENKPQYKRNRVSSEKLGFFIDWTLKKGIETDTTCFRQYQVIRNSIVCTLYFSALFLPDCLIAPQVTVRLVFGDTENATLGSNQAGL